MAIRAITFDFWRTLFREAGEPVERRKIRIDALCDAAGVTAAAAEQALATAEGEFLRHHIEKQQTLAPPDAVRIVSRELAKTFPPNVEAHLADVFGTAILHHPPVPLDHAIEAVSAAAERFAVGVISDAGLSPGSSLRALLDRHGFLSYFKALAFSDEVGVSKPQPAMFHTAADGLGVHPSEMLHIGDLEWTDVIGAKGVGARAALFAGDNTRHRDATSADYTFNSWREFLDALPNLG
jgi:putative hydrolase of the HAD superfamily